MEIVKIENDNLIVSKDLINELKNFEAMRVQMEIKQKELKESLLEAMKKYNITNWQTDDGSIKAVYRSPSKRTTIDSTRLKKELPDIAEEYSKVSDVKESVSLSIEV